MARTKSINQLSLFEEAEPAPRSVVPQPEFRSTLNYRQALEQEIIRDVQTLRNEWYTCPGRDFYEARIASYREELARIGDWDGFLPPSAGDVVQGV